MPPTPDHLLVDAALLGDRSAFDQLYYRYGAVVFSYAFEALGDRDEAASVTQDVFIITWEKLEKVDLRTGALLPWLLGVSRGEVANAARRAKHRLKVVDIADYETTTSDDDPVEARVSAQQLLARTEREVAAMPPLDAAVFRALIHDGLSYDETAVKLGITVGNVSKRMNHIRSVLRDRVGRGR